MRPRLGPAALRHAAVAGLLALAGIPAPAGGQEEPVVGDSVAADSIQLAVPDSASAAVADSAAAAGPADSAGGFAADSLERVRRDVESARERLQAVRETLQDFPDEDRLRRSPRGAVLRAFAVPGWGQFYTGHRFRAFMYGTAEVGFTALGFLEQREVNALKDDITGARLAYVDSVAAADPDTVLTRADSLALFERFDDTPQGAELDAELEDRQKRREDYFTYAIFSVLFAAIDAFVSAHLQPYDAPRAEVRRAPAGWELGVRIPVGEAVGP
ncbi:MAG: DUF5683 domain-containing protein [Gemmatimonadota bacterium]